MPHAGGIGLGAPLDTLQRPRDRGLGIGHVAVPLFLRDDPRHQLSREDAAMGHVAVPPR